MDLNNWNDWKIIFGQAFLSRKYIGLQSSQQKAQNYFSIYGHKLDKNINILIEIKAW